MKVFNKNGLKVFIIVAAISFLVACSRVNERNYARIEQGMSLQQVVAILGEPTSSDSIGFGGFSGTSVVWKNKDVVISVQFLNDKVQIKSLSREKDQNIQTVSPATKAPKQQ